MINACHQSRTGRGLRLKQPGDRQLPECLLRFAGKSLLERHLLVLRSAPVSRASCWRSAFAANSSRTSLMEDADVPYDACLNRPRE
jgi:hypothetical protein